MYSLVIPAHNEAKNLPKLVGKSHSALKKTRQVFEIIIVNDNSTDNSYGVLKMLQKKFKELRIVNRASNPGVGYAIRQGISSAKGSIIITMDGDLSHDPYEMPKLLAQLKNYDMVCGSRYTKGGKANMASSRKLVSVLFNIVFRTLIGIKVRDFTSGYRAYNADILKKISLKSRKFGIFIEIPLKAYLAGFRLAEVPITYHKREHGKSNLNFFKKGPEYLKVALEAIWIKIWK